MSLVGRVRNLLRGEALSRDIDRELAFHLAEKADELEAQGLSREAAMAEARRRFGRPTQLQERTREMDIVAWIESIAADVRYALRALRLNPGFAAVAVLSLALGIGANTAIFTLLNAVMLKPLPVADPQSLFAVSSAPFGSKSTRSTFTNPIWEALQARGAGIADFYAYSGTTFDLSGGGEVRQVQANYVSGGFFGVLGVGPAAGRLISPSDDARGCPPVAVLSDGFAHTQFGDPRGAVGRTVSLDAHPFTVIGVAPPSFWGVAVGFAPAVYVPICSVAVFGDQRPITHRSWWWLSIGGRLAPGRTLRATAERMRAIRHDVYQASLPQDYEPSAQHRFLADELRPVPAAAGESSLRSRYGESLTILLAVVGAVLLIACANVAHLLLARATARSREMAVRLAIGAGRSRLARQMITESLVLSGAAAVLGLLFARWAGQLLVSYISTRGDTIWLNLTPDVRVLGFTLGAAVATALVFGLVPAWRATRVEPLAAMKAQGRSVTAARLPLARAMVTFQIALSLMLVVAAGLLIGTFRRMATVDAGFRRGGLLIASVEMKNAAPDSLARTALRNRLLDDLRALPGQSGAAMSMMVPPTGGSGWNEYIAVTGDSSVEDDKHLAWFNGVSEGWFAAMGTRLLQGRDFTAADVAGAPPVCIINETMARTQFKGSNPIGQDVRIRKNDGTLDAPLTIVGVVQDARYNRVDEDQLQVAYMPVRQAPWFGTSINYVLPSSEPPASLGRRVAAAVAAESPVASISFTTQEENISDTVRRPRLLATLSGFFGALALLLAVIGLYGTMAYGVTRRRGEIGIRLALGADRLEVWTGVLREAGLLIAAGSALGIAGAWAASRLIAAFLYGMGPRDPLTFAGSAVVLACCGLAACALPAWQAARVDPAETLRND